MRISSRGFSGEIYWKYMCKSRNNLRAFNQENGVWKLLYFSAQRPTKTEFFNFASIRWVAVVLLSGPVDIFNDQLEEQWKIRIFRFGFIKRARRKISIIGFLFLCFRKWYFWDFQNSGRFMKMSHPPPLMVIKRSTNESTNDSWNIWWTTSTPPFSV